MTLARMVAIALAAHVVGAGAYAAITAEPFLSPLRAAPSTATGEVVSPKVVARGVVDVDGGMIQIAAPRDGLIREVRVEEGASVRQGDILLVIDDRLPRAALAVARAELSQAEVALAATQIRIAAAKREVARIEPLKEKNIAPVRSFDQATDTMRLAEADLHVQAAAIETARAKLVQAELEVEQRAVRAPVDGVIVRRLARPGDGASTLNVTTLFWLAPSSPRIGRIEIEEMSAERVKPGQAVEIIVEGDDTRRFKASVLRVNRAFGPRRATVYDTRERADVRFAEAVLNFQDGDPGLMLGQRIIAHIRTE